MSRKSRMNYLSTEALMYDTDVFLFKCSPDAFLKRAGATLASVSFEPYEHKGKKYVYMKVNYYGKETSGPNRDRFAG
jgi:hypothetical protein